MDKVFFMIVSFLAGVGIGYLLCCSYEWFQNLMDRYKHHEDE